MSDNLPVVYKSSYEQSSRTDAVEVPKLQAFWLAVGVAVLWLLLSIWGIVGLKYIFGVNVPFLFIVGIILTVPILCGCLTFLSFYKNRLNYWSDIVHDVMLEGNYAQDAQKEIEHLRADLAREIEQLKAQTTQRPTVIDRRMEIVRSDPKDNNGMNKLIGDLPFSERIPILIEGLVRYKKDFTTTVWARNDGETSNPNKLFSQPEWKMLREAMVKNGLIRKINPNQRNSEYVFTEDYGQPWLKQMFAEIHKNDGELQIIQQQQAEFTPISFGVKNYLEPDTPPPGFWGQK